MGLVTILYHYHMHVFTSEKHCLDFTSCLRFDYTVYSVYTLHLFLIMVRDSDLMGCPEYSPTMNIRTFEEELRQHLKVRAGLMPNERYANSGNEAEARLWRSKEMDSKEKEMAIKIEEYE